MKEPVVETISQERAHVESGIASPVSRQRRIRAVLFDLDGTLYRQRPLRLLMALELGVASICHPLTGRRQIATVAAYRNAQDQLRRQGLSADIARRQVALAAQTARIPEHQVDRIVNEWMLRRPLKYLRACRVRGLLPLLAFLEQRGVRAGVLSDYPAHEKLRALGIAGRFSPILSADDVGAFKPDPRGFRRACELWGLSSEEVLVVGDRVDTDAIGAAAAGMDAVIIGTDRIDSARLLACLFLPSLQRLHRVLEYGF